MGRDTLKYVLSQQVQLLERDFDNLKCSGTSWNDLQVRSMEIIAITIPRLSNSITTLTNHETLSVDMRHELRNQITIVMGYAQLMLHRRAGEMPLECTAYLQKMMVIVMHINTSLDQDKHQALIG